MKLISETYRALNRELHESDMVFGDAGHRWKDKAEQLIEGANAQSILDYGCGKSTLIGLLDSNVLIQEYDPCIPEKEISPAPTEVVLCTDVLEHVEEKCIKNVLDHLQMLSRKAIFIVIALRESNKVLPDGRNAHILIKPRIWWLGQLKSRFPNGRELRQGNKNKIHFLWYK